MTSEEIREKFLKFFEKREHKIMPSSSLVPENDASVLFTTAGMQQFKPYYIGKASPMSDLGRLNACSVQKCVRTSDIDEVGDERHLTFFEMLGNFSFGGYWKKEVIQYAYDFVVGEMNLKIDYVTVFAGEEGVPADTESEQIWKSIDQNIVVKKFGRADNFWGPTGEEGPCGPTTEIYVDGIEIWNIVFNEFYQSSDKSLKPLEIKGIDTGMGLERLAKVVQKVDTVFETDLFEEIMSRIPLDTTLKRIIADHLRTAVFMIADEVKPSNTERGYILRRILRRVLLKIMHSEINIDELVQIIVHKYSQFYPEIENNLQDIIHTIQNEQQKFESALKEGMKEFKKVAIGEVDGKTAFKLFSSYGFPFEMIEELAKEKGVPVDRKGFEDEMKKHQEISKAGMEQKFKGGLGGHSEMEVKYHTATHLLHQALRDVLGMRVEQKGSNITPERLRFDFSHPQKIRPDEIKKVEDIVNQKITEALPMNNVILPKDEAQKSGALHFFGDLPAQADKYGEEVSIYYIGPSLEAAYSKEFCGGPHVKNTSELGVFKITKEEAISAGIRRIKAVLN